MTYKFIYWACVLCHKSQAIRENSIRCYLELISNSLLHINVTFLLMSLFNCLFCQVDLLRGQKSDKVDVTLAPEELDVMENVLPAKSVEDYSF